MGNFITMAAEENVENLFVDVPNELTEKDYLDCFMDLAEFFQLEDSSKVHETASTGVNEVTNGKLDFSGVISVPSTVLTANAVPDLVISVCSLKRKQAGEIDDLAAVIDIGHELSMLDHDYITKIPKLALPAVSLKSKPHHLVPKVSEKNQYRERRDKNNEASKRSRQIRNIKFKEMDKEAEILTVKNEDLRRQILELEALVKTMKATLIQKMTAK